MRGGAGSEERGSFLENTAFAMYISGSPDALYLENSSLYGFSLANLAEVV